MSDRINHAEAGIRAIELGLEDAASVTIESALIDAVKNDRMDRAEANECFRAYLRSLGGVAMVDDIELDIQ
jgi:hypothetical protein